MFAWHQTLQMCPEQTLTSPATSPTCLPCTASAVLTNYRAKSRLETSSANLEIDTNRGERRLCCCYFHFTVHVINNLLKTSLPSELTWHCYCKSCLIPGLTQNYESSEVANYFSIDDRPCWTDRDTMTKVYSYLLQPWERRRRRIAVANFMLSSFYNCNVAKIFQRTSGRGRNTKF